MRKLRETWKWKKQVLIFSKYVAPFAAISSQKSQRNPAEKASCAGAHGDKANSLAPASLAPITCTTESPTLAKHEKPKTAIKEPKKMPAEEAMWHAFSKIYQFMKTENTILCKTFCWYYYFWKMLYIFW